MSGLVALFFPMQNLLSVPSREKDKQREREEKRHLWKLVFFWRARYSPFVAWVFFIDLVFFLRDDFVKATCVRACVLSWGGVGGEMMGL